MIDYKVDRTENCVLIDTNNWVENTSNILKTYKISGKQVNTYIAKILETNINENNFPTLLSKGDKVLLTKIISEIARDRGHKLLDEERYYDVPVMQIIGYFKDNIISYDSLIPIYDKVIMEKIDTCSNKIVSHVEDNSMICRILKVGTNSFDKNWNRKPLRVREGDIVLVKDNVTTTINLENKNYYATEESSIVAIFKDENLSIEEATFINESIIMEDFQEEKAFGSSTLWAPRVNYEMVDYTELYNRNLFKIKYVDENLNKLNTGDTILADRDVTFYAYINNEKYFLLNGMDYVEAKIKL